MTISRLRMASDGTGVSTLVAFYGCPLQCRYCANWICHDEATERKYYSPENLISILSQDDIYYKMTGGGIVFGGGEPLMQADFIHEVCKVADPLWERRIETSLYANWEQINLLVEDIEEWFVDIKDLQPEIYKKYTGKENGIVLSNLRKLASVVPKEKIMIRVPHIANFNTPDDVKQSMNKLRSMGLLRLDEFEYVVPLTAPGSQDCI